MNDFDLLRPSLIVSPERSGRSTVRHTGSYRCGTLWWDVSKFGQHDAFLGKGYFEYGASEQLCK